MLRKSVKKDFVIKICDFFKKQTLFSTCIEAGLTLSVSDSVTQTVENYIFSSIGSSGDDWYRLGRFTLIGTALIVSILIKSYHIYWLIFHFISGTSCVLA